MNIKSKLPIALLAFLVLQLGCVKLPDRVDSPNIRVNYSNTNGKAEYTLIFSCILQNDNPNTVLVDLSANVEVSIRQSDIVEIFPIKAKSILPFNLEIVESVQKRTREEILPLMEALDIDESELIEDGTIPGIFFRSSEARLTEIKSSNMRIKDYLKGKMKERLNENDN